MSPARRAAAAIAVALLFSALLTTLRSIEASGFQCGTWVSPRFTVGDEPQEAGDGSPFTDGGPGPFGDDGLTDPALPQFPGAPVDGAPDPQTYERLEAITRLGADACDGPLATRRAVSLGLVGLAVVVPIGMLVVGRRRRDDTEPTE